MHKSQSFGNKKRSTFSVPKCDEKFCQQSEIACSHFSPTQKEEKTPFSESFRLLAFFARKPSEWNRSVIITVTSIKFFPVGVSGVGIFPVKIHSRTRSSAQLSRSLSLFITRKVFALPAMENISAYFCPRSLFISGRIPRGKGGEKIILDFVVRKKKRVSQFPKSIIPLSRVIYLIMEAN